MTCFFDTNVLVYAVDPGDPVKQERALRLYARSVADRSFVISTQVLIEFYSVVTRGARGSQPLLERAQARAQVAALARQRVITTTPRLIVDATARVERDGMHWFDALLVEAAFTVGATTFYSEDFQHRRQLGDLTVINPFVLEGT